MEKILVIGGTGTMGTPLVTQLYEKGYDVSVVCRRPIGNNQNNIKFYYGNAKDLFFLKDVLNQHFDVIVDFCVYSSREFIRNYQTLLNATNQYICLSSSAVYADMDEPKTETSPRYMETDPPIEGDKKYYWYCYEKARVEDTLRKSHQKNWTIIRPGITVNRNHVGWGINWGDDWFLRIIQGKKVIVPQEMLPFKTSITYGGFVAKMLMYVIGNKNALGEIYNVTSPEEFTWQELLGIYKDIFLKYGYELRVKYVKSCEMVNRDNRYEEVYYRARLLDRRFDSSKLYLLMEDKSFTPLVSLLETWTAEIIKGNNKVSNRDIVHTAQIDKLTGDKVSREDFVSVSSYYKYCVARHTPFIFSCLILGKQGISKICKRIGITRWRN